mgnify:CR=1 FL=1|jgi:hypothetical protein
MRKEYIISVLIFCAVFFAYSEIQAQDYGLKGGLVISTINGQGNSSLRPGLQLGAYKNFGATERLFVQMEALFTQKGSWNWDNENQSNINLYYFDFALIFGVLAGEKITLNLGIQPSVLLGGIFKYSANGQAENQSLKGEVSAMDYATLFGLEYDLNDNFTLGGRFNYSFVPLQSYDNIFADNGELPYSMVFQLYGKLKMDKLLKMIKGGE